MSEEAKNKAIECEKPCGENHCDTNGCSKRKRILTEIQDKNE